MRAHRQAQDNQKAGRQGQRQNTERGTRLNVETKEEPLEILLQRASVSPRFIAPAAASRLQRSIGNQDVGRLNAGEGHAIPETNHHLQMSSSASLQAILRHSATVAKQALKGPGTVVQAKLTLCPVSEKHESKADRGIQRQPPSITGQDTFFRQRGFNPGVAQAQDNESITNPAASILIQRKPDDIDETHTLQYRYGKIINKEAERGKDSPARPLNWKIREKWVEPEDRLIGGHLFKREYGGPDDVTNVVPWSENTEKVYSDFEKEYADKTLQKAEKAKADKVTKGLGDGGYKAEVSAKARFEERPELKTDNNELEGAGWKSDDPGKGERAKEFDDVAEKFASIPAEVTVTVTVSDSETLTFTKDRAGIEPPYKKSPDALKPAFKPAEAPVDLDAKLPRKLVKLTKDDWKSKSSWVKHKLQHAFSKHHQDFFGAKKNWSENTGKEFEQLLVDHIESTDTKQILGTYRGAWNVLHYVNTDTNLWCCTDEKNQLIAAWKLFPSQLKTLLSKGTVA